MDIDLTCGFKTNKNYKLSSVLCGVVRGSKLSQVVSKSDPLTCTGLSEKMASNIIRVAANRIFSDPNKSFIEPISNSIDSYNSLKGVKSIGKFGMGFFSLMYWLDTPGSKLEVSSSDGNCYWKVLITKDNDDYYFRIKNSSIKTPNAKKPIIYKRGTTVELSGIKYEKDDAAMLIHNTFCFTEGVVINLKVVRSPYLTGVVNEKYMEGSNDLIEIVLSSNMMSVTDHATGILFENIFDKLLVPSISTKTLSKFISSDVKKYKRSRIDNISQLFYLTVGDVTIYSKNTTTFYPESIDLSYVLSLPAEFPMPVSRDDIIVETEELKNVLFEAMMDLFKSTISKNASVDLLIEHIYAYSVYAKDHNVDIVITRFMDYLRSLPDIIFGPSEHKNLYPLISDPEGVKIISTKTPDLNRLSEYLLSRYKVLDDIFEYVKVIVLPIKSINKDMIRVTPDILIVDTNFAKNPKWVSNLITSSNVILIPANGGKISKSNIEAYNRASQIVMNDQLLRDNYGKIKAEGNNVLDFIVGKCELFIEVILSISNAFNVDMYNAYKQGNKSDALNATLLALIVEIACGFYIITGEYKPILDILYYYFTSALSMDFGDASSADFIYDRLCVGYYYNRYEFKHTYLLSSKNLVTPKISFPSYRDRLIKYYQMSLTNSLESSKSLVLMDPIMHSIFNVPVFVNRIQLVYDIIKDYDVIYDTYISAVFMKVYSDFDKDHIHTTLDTDEYVSSRIKFLYHELSTKKGTRMLEEAYFKIYKNNTGSSSSLIVTEMYNSLKIYDNIMTQRLHIPNRGVDYQNLPMSCFMGTQLVQGIFMNYIKPNDYSWVDKVSRLKGDIPLQTLEITINEGTSKPYVESILTELVQNSIDASLSLENPRIDILVTEDGITVSDQVGIPINGLISLMTPFLSSKGDSGLTTGEMGSGFMNVFRRPGTDHVRIITRDPNNHFGYLLFAYPVVSGSRVVDVKYEISIVRDYPVGGTEIFVAFNSENKDIPSLITSGLLYSNLYLGSVGPDVYINNNLLERNLELLESNQIADIYIDKDYNTTRPTIILTNGVPHSTYSSDIGSGDTLQQASTGLVINIKKDSYTPVQTRKRINVIGADFVSIVRYAGILKIMYSISKTKNFEDLSRYNFTLRNINYLGDPIQVKPNVPAIPYSKGEYYYSNGDLLSRYANEKFGHRNMGMVINDLIKVIGGKEDVTLENISKLAKGSSIYNKTILIWFFTKTFTEGRIKTSEGYIEPKSVVVDLEEGTPIEELQQFVNLIVRRTWEYLKTKIRGYSLYNPPTVKLYLDIEGARGFYVDKEHTISISLKKYDITKLNKAASDIMNLIKEGKHKEAAVYFKSNYDMNQFMGTAPVPRVLVHEFGHAIRRNNHTDDNSHGNFVYSVGSETFDYTYPRGCNELWRLGLQDAF